MVHPNLPKVPCRLEGFQLLCEVEDDLGPAQGDAPHEQWGRGAAPHTTMVPQLRNPTAQQPGKSQLCWNRPGKGVDVPICNKDALHRPGIWRVLMGGRERFQAWGSSQTGWNGLVDVQGDTPSERLRSVMVIRAGDTGRQMSHSEIR